MRWYSEYMMAAIDADKTIVTADGDTYIGRIDRETADFASLTPLESQPVWQIRKIQKRSSGTDVEYTTLYPGGDRRFVFRMADCKTLTYNYSLS